MKDTFIQCQFYTVQPSCKWMSDELNCVWMNVNAPLKAPLRCTILCYPKQFWHLRERWFENCLDPIVRDSDFVHVKIQIFYPNIQQCDRYEDPHLHTIRMHKTASIMLLLKTHFPTLQNLLFILTYSPRLQSSLLSFCEFVFIQRSGNRVLLLHYSFVFYWFFQVEYTNKAQQMRHIIKELTNTDQTKWQHRRTTNFEVHYQSTSPRQRDWQQNIQECTIKCTSAPIQRSRTL